MVQDAGTHVVECSLVRVALLTCFAPHRATAETGLDVNIQPVALVVEEAAAAANDGGPQKPLRLRERCAHPKVKLW